MTGRLPSSVPVLRGLRAVPELFGVDSDFIAADAIRDESGCVLRYDRTFYVSGSRRAVAHLSRADLQRRVGGGLESE